MNSEGELRAEQLTFQQRTAVEERKELIRNRNMSLLCHCSGEIDEGVRRYFGVNDFFVGDGDYILVLASDFSSPQSINGFVGVYQRTCVYSLIEEIADDELTGHFTFYSAQIDGRLAFLFCFLNGLPAYEQSGMLECICEACRQISDRCRSRYALDVVLYVSRLCLHIDQCTQAYERIQLLATLHRFIGRHHIESVIEQRVVVLAAPPEAGEQHSVPHDKSAQSLANALLSGADAQAIADATLDTVIHSVPSVQHLKEDFGNLYEALCVQLRLRGIRFPADRFRSELFQLAERTSNWDEMTDWFRHLLTQVQELLKNRRFESQAAAIERARSYLEQNLGRSSLSIEETASHVGLQWSAFSVAFQASQHCSPSVYLRNARLKRAMHLLQTTDGTIASISEQCGFGSVETFHRAFKVAFGLTPGRLRSGLDRGVPPKRTKK